MVLPVNVDATYPDRNAGDAAHQQHHDEIHAAVNSRGAANGIATLDAAGLLPEAQVPTRLTAAELGASIETQTGIYDVREHGVILDGVTDQTAALNTFLGTLRRGDTAWIDPTSAGCLITGQVIVPRGVRLLGNVPGEVSSEYAEGNTTATTKPGNSTIIVTGTTSSPIVLKYNAVVEGINFFYPDQNYAITSLAQSFTTYPATVQIGDATHPDVSGAQVRRCNFLGATHAIAQYATDGTPIGRLVVDGCGGYPLVSFLRINKANDVAHVRNCHLSPNDLTPLVVAKGGDATVFRTKVAQALTVFHVGAIDDMAVVDFFVYGCHTFYKADTAMFTGDTNVGFGGRFVAVGADVCHKAFHIKRGSNPFPLTVSDSWFTPIVRPNGVGTDSAAQALVYLDGASCANVRMMLTGVRASGAAVAELSTGYSGQADRALVASAAGASNRVLLGQSSFANMGGIIEPASTAHFALALATLDDGFPESLGGYIYASRLGVDESDPGTTPGDLTRFFTIRSGNGAVLGYVPIYSSYT